MNLQPSERLPLAAGSETPSSASTIARLRAALARRFRPGSAASRSPPEEPIRAELFSTERLELHAETLAAAQPVMSKPTTDHRLERRLRDNDRGPLRTAYHATIAAVRRERAVTPAADLADR